MIKISIQHGFIGQPELFIKCLGKKEFFSSENSKGFSITMK